MGFIKERIQSLASKKVAAVGIGLVLVETWPQAAIVAAYLLAQAWTDSMRDQRI